MKNVSAIGDRCRGCLSCAGVCRAGCISVQTDGEGFLTPKVDIDKCVNCGACVSVCPAENPVTKNKSVKAYAVKLKDVPTRAQSSSGGLFTALAKAVLSAGGAVIGAVLNDDNTVSFKAARNENELAPMRGSKYVQADMTGAYELIESAGGRALFTGAPCQAAAVYSRHTLPRNAKPAVVQDVYKGVGSAIGR